MGEEIASSVNTQGGTSSAEKTSNADIKRSGKGEVWDGSYQDVMENDIK